MLSSLRRSAHWLCLLLARRHSFVPDVGANVNLRGQVKKRHKRKDLEEGSVCDTIVGSVGVLIWRCRVDEGKKK